MSRFPMSISIASLALVPPGSVCSPTAVPMAAWDITPSQRRSQFRLTCFSHLRVIVARIRAGAALLL